MGTEDWYVVKGCTKYRGETCHLAKAEILVRASSIEHACKKAREFLEPIADFEPTRCEWQGD